MDASDIDTNCTPVKASRKKTPTSKVSDVIIHLKNLIVALNSQQRLYSVIYILKKSLYVCIQLFPCIQTPWRTQFLKFWKRGNRKGGGGRRGVICDTKVSSLEKLHSNCSTAQVENCTLKPGKLEAASWRSWLPHVLAPLKHFHWCLKPKCAVQLKELNNLAVSQHVTILVEVVCIKEAVTVSER